VFECFVSMFTPWGLCCILFVSMVLGRILECRLIPHVMSFVLQCRNCSSRRRF